jgi:hypothetical protein
MQAMKWRRRALVALAAWMALALCAAAQVRTGAIAGRVLDPQGRAVAQARVLAVRVGTGARRVAYTSASGWYALPLLPVGRYRVAAQAAGFARARTPAALALNVAQTLTVNFRLRLGGVRQTVTVSANAARLDQGSTSLGQVVGQRKIATLPLDGRDFTQLGLLQPGVNPISPGVLRAGGGLRNGEPYEVNGMRPESNDFLIDGFENVNVVDGGLLLRPPLDAIQQFRIITGGGSAAFGNDMGSTTDIITRSGNNQWHGSLYDYLRNTSLDARNFFSPSVQPYRQNQFGGALGGPIRRNRTFFYFYYEGVRNAQGETTAATVPTQLERQGNFSQSGQPLINYETGQPVPNNTLTSINPIAAKLLSEYPVANDGPALFNSTQMLTNSNDQYGLRVDQDLGASDHLFARAMWNGGQEVDPFSPIGANVPGFPVGQNDHALDISLEETHLFSPNLIGVARLEYLRNHYVFAQSLNHTLPQSLGFQYASTLAAAAGPPYISVAGEATIGDTITGPTNTVQNSWREGYTLSWVAGAHQASAGVDFGQDSANGYLAIAPNGFYVFSNFPYSIPFANFLAGDPVVFMQGGGDLSRQLLGRSIHAYGQDKWQLSRRLVLSAGLRYELDLPYTEARNRQNIWAPGQQSVMVPNAPPGMLYPGDPGVPAGLIPTDFHAMAPRLGLSWDPTGSGQWLVSAAYGIFYDPYLNGAEGVLQDTVGAPPFVKIPQIPLPNFASPLPPNAFAPGFVTPMTLLTVDRNMTRPYAQEWNLRVQRTLGRDWVAQLAYVGNEGTHLPRFVEGNPAVYVPGQSSEQNVNQRRLYSGCTLAQPTNCVYGSSGLISTIANSSYNAFEAELDRHFAHGLQMQFSYTFSKALDDSSSFNLGGSGSGGVAGENDLAQNPFNLAAEYGRSLFDARNRFVMNYVWRLPRAPFWAPLLGGWTAAGIVTLQSGMPFTVYEPNDVSLTGSAPEISGYSANRPNLVGNPNNGPHTVAEWFKVNAFQRLNPVTQAGQFGSEGRNVVTGPGLADWDFSLLRTIALAESRSLQFRAEVFNFLNHPNFDLPNNMIGTPNFGAITEARSPRLVQLALRLRF